MWWRRLDLLTVMMHLGWRGWGGGLERGVRVADTRRTGWVKRDSAFLLWEARRTATRGFELLFSIGMPKNSCAVCGKAKCILLKEITVIRSPHPDRSWRNSRGRIIPSSGPFRDPYVNMATERKIPSERERKIALEMGKMVHLSKRQALWVCQDNDQFTPSPLRWYHCDRSGFVCGWMAVFDWNLDGDH